MKYVLPTGTPKLLSDGTTYALFPLFANPIYTNAPFLNSFYSGISPAIAEWNSGTTYALNAYAYQKDSRRIFRSNMASNLNRDPTLQIRNLLNDWHYPNQAPDDGTHGGWTDLGSSNDYNAVDEFLTSQAEGTAGTPLVYEFNFTKSTTLALFNMKTQTLKVEIFNTFYPLYSGNNSDYITGDKVHKIDNKIYQFTSPSTWTYISDVTEMYTNTINITYRSNIIGLFEWLSEPFNYRKDYVLRNLPFYFGGTYKIRITLDNKTEKALLGNVIIGKKYDLGATAYNTQNDLLSFSTFSRNTTTGELYLKKGNATKRVTIPLYLTAGQVEYVEQTVRDLDGKIVYFIGDDIDGRFGNIDVLGVVRTSNVGIKAFNDMTANIEIEGII